MRRVGIPGRLSACKRGGPRCIPHRGRRGTGPRLTLTKRDGFKVHSDFVRTAWRGTGPRPTQKRGRFSTQKPAQYRSAGACPPRTSGRPQHGEGQVFPPPYAEEGAVFQLRNPPGTVARGPVPREYPVDRSMARDRPSPHAEEGPFFDSETRPVPERGGLSPANVWRILCQ